MAGPIQAYEDGESKRKFLFNYCEFTIGDMEKSNLIILQIERKINVYMYEYLIKVFIYFKAGLMNL